MSQKIKQSFGERNIKYLAYWTFMFLFYRVFLNTTLITLTATLCLLILFIKLVQHIAGYREQFDEAEEFKKQKLITQLIHSWVNSLFNTFGKIFRNSGLMDVGLVVGILYGLSKLSFVCQDSTFVYIAGCILLLAPGFNRLLGGSLAEVEKDRTINKIVRSQSLTSK